MDLELFWQNVATGVLYPIRKRTFKPLYTINVNSKALKALKPYFKNLISLSINLVNVTPLAEQFVQENGTRHRHV